MSTPSAKDAFDNETFRYELFHTNGRTAIKTFQKNGEFHGPYVSCDQNGQEEAIGVYFEGKKIDIWTYPQADHFVLYNKDGEEHVKITDLGNLTPYIHILEQTVPLSDAAVSEAEAFMDQRQAQEDAYQAYRRGQPNPGL